MMLSFWADAVVALLLVATIGYSAVLNRRLTAVRADRDQFASVIRDLGAATQRAESAVAGLRATADDLGRRVDKKIEEGRALRDDLAYMIERGGAIADKLEAQLRSGRDRLKPDATPQPHVVHSADGRPEHQIEPLPHQAQAPSYPGTRARSTVAAHLPQAALPPETGNMASRAERDLVRALGRRR
jgi:Domain of unknown function (DUF6468)